MTDGIGAFADAFAAIGDRWSEYAEVVRAAALRNADGDYAADDWLVDVERLFGMGLRDAARFGVAAVEAMAPFVEQVRDWNDAPADPPADPPAGDAAAG